MEPQTPHHQETTVGRVQVPPMVFDPAHHSALLAGRLTGAHVATANSARRRLYGPTLLGSPARRGHTPKMADIFGDAKNNLASKSVPAMKVASPMPTLRQLPLRPKTDSVLNHGPLRPYPSPTRESESAPLYPILRANEVHEPTDPERLCTPPMRKQENESKTRHPKALYDSFHLHPPPARLSPAPGSSEHSYFNLPPQIHHAQIVPMNTIQTNTQPQDGLSSSSASWTGDSQFYMPQLRHMPLPSQERKSSVPEWLAELPAEPAEFEKASSSDIDEDMEIVPLSPDVELERGSMRRKMRGNGERKRCRSVDSMEED